MSGTTTEVAPDVDRPAGPVPQVAVFGIRHHGPGSARSVLAALADFRPDVVLIEGPADAQPLLGWAAAEGMVPPVALLAYAADRPSVAAFWPYAEFSPEWQALRWAIGAGVEVAFCDLPAAVTLARQRRTDTLFDGDHPEPGPEDSDEQVEPTEQQVASHHRHLSRDPLALLAEAAGYDDAERWWDDVVESRLDGSSPFPVLVEAMAEMRLELGPGGAREAEEEARREAYMRTCIRARLKAGAERVAVVCGAWHAPVLGLPLPPASADAKVLRGMAKRKVTLTWVPWTHERLASASGYGAGIASPGWYHHLWTAPDRPIVRWLTRVARALRRRDLAVSSAHVIEAVRLAETLAGLRQRPLAGLAEVTDATRAVLCDGDELAVRYVTDELVVGQRIGSVDPEVPTVPLEADLVKRCRTLRIRREARVRDHDLDLRKDYDQQRSVLFHRLRLLELGWIEPAESGVQGQGTFRETWRSQWRPELSVALVEASVWGTTVESAATAKVDHTVAEGTLAELTRDVERCLLADLPEVLRRLLAALTDRAALDADVVHLMDALPALARAQRYGDVRGTDVTALAQVSEALLLRICTGLPQAVGGLDESGAVAMRQRVDGVQRAIGLLTSSGADAGLAGRWHATLAQLVDRPDLNGQLLGRIVRMLFDAALLDDVPVRMERALSHGVEPADKAAWVDGFFSDGALLLIHDATLRGLLDAWVAGLSESEFVDTLPLVRRTFGTFGDADRRAIAHRVVDPQGATPSPVADDAYDLELAGPALATVALILGRPGPAATPR